MNINSNYTITLGNRNIVKIMKGSTVIWEKSTTPVVTPDYFYIKNVSSGDTNWLQYKFNNQPSRDTIQQIEYSYDKQNWTTVTLQGGGSYQNLCSLPAGGTVYLRNNNGKFNFSLFYLSFKSTVNHEVGGDIYTLLDYTNPNVSLTSQDTFEHLFENDLGLVRAGNLTLGFDTLNENCYSLMFLGCSNLTTAPSLPATTLAIGCYTSMFGGCTSLTTAPSLPATTVAPSCYKNMFYGCTSLTTAPSLPATTVTISSYSEMFEGCTSLTTAPALPATSLGMSCYYKMFKNCTSLTTTPSLPATSLLSGCYQYMFQGCTSLTTTQTLPATTLANSCYYGMFDGCTSLSTAPALPATTIVGDCYNTMFKDCTSLTTAPALPATTLAQYCYYYMFQGCTALTTAPELPATTLVSYCYSSMFDGCTSLNSVTTYADDISASGCIDYWLQNVASVGTFYNNGSATYTVDSASGIPQGWTEVKPSTGPDYFYIENVDSQSGNVSFKFRGTPSASTIQQIEYSKDKTNWTPVTLVANTTNNVPVSVGEKVYFRNNNGKFSSAYNIYFTFGGDVLHDVGGDINTLLDYTTDTTTLSVEYIFYSLFKNDIKLRNAGNLTLGYTTLSDSCYSDMFSDCTSLTTAPVLPVTTLSDSCYSGMFYGCTSLTTAPVLPATTLSDSCYSDMFSDCTSLTTAPELPSTTLSDGCYYEMFNNCTSLNSVTTYADDISATDCLTNWLYNVAATGTFHNLGSATYQSGASGIPQGWTEVKPSTGPDYFYIENVDGASDSVSFTFNGTPDSSTIQQIEWSKDKTHWTTVTLDEYSFNSVPIDVGEKVYFRNSNGYCSNDYAGYLNFTLFSQHKVGGNLYTLLDYTNENVILPYNIMGVFKELFSDDNGLIDASDLVLPWTVLTDNCYQEMFYGCTSLTTAPELPATTLTDNCYQQMFSGCTSLNEVTIYADDISAIDCLIDWLSNVAATGTFYNKGNAMYDIDSSSGIPQGWTEVRS